MRLHVFPGSPNSRKTLTVNEMLGLGLDSVVVDLPGGAQQSAEFLPLNPNGKVPVLELDDGSTLWESNAIINRLAAEKETPLWPKSMARYDIMRWQFWESAHWAPACSKFISKHLFKNDSIDLNEAKETFRRFAGVLDGHLAGRDWLVGDALTNADISVAAILCYREPCQYPMADFANINRWIGQVEAQPAWQLANAA
jgi:glutathione S-transferase